MQWPGKALETLPDMRRLPVFVGVMSASGTAQGSVFYVPHYRPESHNATVGRRHNTLWACAYSPQANV
jgi:hypothetical protein